MRYGVGGPAGATDNLPRDEYGNVIITKNVYITARQVPLPITNIKINRSTLNFTIAIYIQVMMLRFLFFLVEKITCSEFTCILNSEHIIAHLFQLNQG